MVYFAKYGLVLIAIALVAGWWYSRNKSSARGVTISVWGVLASLIALAIAQPISSGVNERRPFVAIPTALTLIHHSTDAGFPSDHATAAGAGAAALVFVSWQLGVLAWVIALLIAFSRVYVGVHYPQDVLAGLGLGAVVACLGVWLLVPFLTRITDWLANTPLRPLVTASRRAAVIS